MQIVRYTWVFVAKDKSNHPVADSPRRELEQLYQVKRMIGGIGNMLFSIYSQTKNGYHPRGSLVNLWGQVITVRGQILVSRIGDATFLAYCVLCVSAFLRFCVVCVVGAMCGCWCVCVLVLVFLTLTSGRGACAHGDVLTVHTGFSTCHTTPHAHTATTTTYTTQHETGTERDREGQRETDRDRERRQREERRQRKRVKKKRREETRQEGKRR